MLLTAVMLAAACGASGSDAAAGAGGSGQGGSGPLAFAQCMRAHGVTNFPDPDAQGYLTLPQGIDPNTPQFQAAGQACASLLPDAGPGRVTAPQNLAGLAQYATCMQQHGQPISAGANGQLSFDSGVDPNSPQFQAASKACQKLVPAGLPGGAP
ncbi:hypothetical protein [Pseudofrankia inefficax]|uniref:hypothetical protein n=1 Tax=Pseudofrankia inefficax (strain DSM 45817 / CECT 9037 / DDB 130130 / EuI1c) TaxID=298654 RepID=UPI00059D8C8A|nr:hypothetical protein [Pseudofrankia inefficax]